MAVATIHTLHAVQTLSPAAAITELEQLDVSTGITELVGYSAGHHEPLFRGVIGQRPLVTFSTPQLTTLFNTIGAGFNGKDLSAGQTYLYFRKATDLGTREAVGSTVHRRLALAQAMLYWSTVTASHQGQARANCQIGVTYDGINEPVIPAGSVAVGGTIGAAEHFTAGPCYLDFGAGYLEINDIQDITIDSGVRVVPLGGSGELWDTFIGVQQNDPTVTITTLSNSVTGSLNLWDEIGLDARAITQLKCILRAVRADGGAYGLATTVHIKFENTAGGIAQIDRQAAGGNNPQSTTLRFGLRGTSSLAPMTITTGVAGT